MWVVEMQRKYCLLFTILITLTFCGIVSAIPFIADPGSYNTTINASGMNGFNIGGLNFTICRDNSVAKFCGYSAVETPWGMGYNFAASRKISAIRWYNLASAERSKSFYLQYSNNNSTWINITPGSLFDNTVLNSTQIESTNINGWNSVNFTPVNATNFRIYIGSFWQVSDGDQNAGISEIEIYEHIPSLPVATNFTATPDNGMVWSSFQFNDSSTNTPTMWNYSFTNAAPTTWWYNGTTVAAQNLTWIPTTGGNVSVKLWAQNSGGGNYSAKQQYLDVWNWSPASFTGTPLLGANPLSVTFSGSSNNATDYYWQFGDSSTDTVQNPTHIYTADGTYNVNYRTKNAYHSGNWSNQTGYIQVNVTLTSDFTGSPTVGYAPLDVAFVDMSTGDGLYYWEWDFGDTGTSLLRNPSHTYTTSGAFNVKLTAKGSDGTAVTTKNGYINVLYPFSKYTDPLGYILANGADNKIRFYDFKNATDGEYIEIIVSGSYEVP
jgi:PKD repeat protein